MTTVVIGGDGYDFPIERGRVVLRDDIEPILPVPIGLGDEDYPEPLDDSPLPVEG